MCIQNSGIEKAFLFDVVSKIYIATDSSPVDMQSYELCCDMIDVVIDVSCIYGSVVIHAVYVPVTRCYRVYPRIGPAMWLDLSVLA